MLQGLIIKKVLDIVMKQLLKQFKLDKIQEFVENPNELDKQVSVLTEKIDKYDKIFDKLREDVAQIKSISHTPVKGLNKRLEKLEKK